jgi:hypothetical protein
MKITRKQLTKLILDHMDLLLEQPGEEAPDEDVDFDPEASDLKLTPAIQKLLDPDINPQKFVQLDAMLDERGTFDQKAQALAGYALTYGQNDPATADKLLKKAAGFAKKMAG